ncbi:hypothetical protein OSB04_000188 [Centaurea solstitialis]|uniref:UBL3-like ubiquitin domain-containing protein n=1 Tax=Centaurea solstitialis TaxID=347529 RepID=A0AA38U6W6_9ASTR|nr:hypothetical protein OSB04_000188 [Centaurea solstitialis]
MLLLHMNGLFSRIKKVYPNQQTTSNWLMQGKFLENNKTAGQCRTPFGELPNGVITMHVVVQVSLSKAKQVL